MVPEGAAGGGGVHPREAKQRPGQHVERRHKLATLGARVERFSVFRHRSSHADRRHGTSPGGQRAEVRSC